MSERIRLTELDFLRLREIHANLRTEIQDLTKSTADQVLRGVRKEEEVGCEDVSAMLRCRTMRMAEIHNVLNNASVEFLPNNADKVELGTKVTITRDGKGQVWEIVGHSLSDGESRTAYDTPLASLLLGKKVGDKFSGLISNKVVNIEVLAIEVANGNGKLEH